MRLLIESEFEDLKVKLKSTLNEHFGKILKEMNEENLPLSKQFNELYRAKDELLEAGKEDLIQKKGWTDKRNYDPERDNETLKKEISSSMIEGPEGFFRADKFRSGFADSTADAADTYENTAEVFNAKDATDSATSGS